MRAIVSTQWKDTKVTSLEAVEEAMRADHLDTLDASVKYTNWEITKLFDESKRITLNGRSIAYNGYEFSYSQPATGRKDEPTEKNGFVIAYLDDNQIRYIINRYTGAKTILRKLLLYKGQSEIQKDYPELSVDMFMWIIYKVYSQKNIIESGEKKRKEQKFGQLKIDNVRGFKGNTEDLLTKVKASGESVMNMLSTMSFLLESQNINQINLDVAYPQYTNLDLSLSLNSVNSVSINTDRCCGPLMPNCESLEDIFKIFLILYVEVIPLLNEKYKQENKQGLWGEEKFIEFLESVAEKLSNKVEKRIQELKQGPKQLKMR